MGDKEEQEAGRNVGACGNGEGAGSAAAHRQDENGAGGRNEGARLKDRVNRILEHPVFQRKLAKLHELEKERPFCRHGIEHLLDVARLSMILYLEDRELVRENGGASLNGNPREILYGAALLHDIGRGRQYLDGTPHEEEGRRLAPPILADCGYTREEAFLMAEAIGLHRKPEAAREPGLAGILYRADKMSRSCFACRMERECDWKNGKKNRKLVY